MGGVSAKNRLELNNKPVIIFSASLGGELTYAVLKKYGIRPIGFCDNSEKMQGRRKLGLSVMSFSEMLEIYKQAAVNIVIGSYTYFAPIHEQLLSAGIKEEHIYFFETLTIYFDTGVNIKPISITDDEMAGLKKIMLNMMKIVHNICEKHGIDYFLWDGTLLGAVRHKGFIPWDDDVDLAMMRDDYERFFEICKSELPDGYSITSPVSDPMTPVPLKHIRKDNTAREIFPYKITSCDYHNGITIDIVPLDNVRRKGGIITNLQKVCSIVFHQAVNFKFSRRLASHYRYRMLTVLLSKLNAERLHSVKLWIQKFYNKHKTRYVHFFFEGNSFVPLKRKIFERELFMERIMLEFEGYRFWTVKHYRTILESVYGDDYMTPSPEASRRTHLVYELVINEETKTKETNAGYVL